ncbi:Tetratricopeptide domain protein [Chthoniobacter flavus Ellin428]|uniref:Tetratricopeptide domain protein n=1 Tax=Chthoniobacter flavus Ellin428 TaxID=497964 RepID=B4D3I8_9BACT|nr:tetratricopeptide repeat protein [Chthoniobacter flavus]EDY18818.1 Tetratricopeptide domain protein [Chthoniobacter flavus Ellin428]TCO93416.1 tetratricopeptide repeat protein [Chthoniobacter flavus]
MPITTEKDLSENSRALWLKAAHAVELKNFGYAISLIQNILKEAPGFLDARKTLRKVEIIATRGKKSFLSGLSTASLKGAGMVKKDPVAAMELAEKTLESDPTNVQINHLLKEASKAAGYPEIAAFALETIVEANPTDTKTMHELGEHYLTMGRADEAVNVYSKIAEINPGDLTAVKRSKDAAATASMKKGGWDTAQSYRDLMKNKDEAISLEQKSRVVKSVEMIDEQLGELTPQWEEAQTNVDLTRRIAKLWEDRFEQRQDDESLDGAYYYYHHTNELVGGSDPAVARKLSTLQLQRIDMRVKALEDWLAQGGEGHDEAEAYRNELAELKRHKAELLITEAKKRVERNPTDLQLRFELGEQLVRAAQYTEAIQELQRAKQNPNARLKAMNLLGQCYTEKNMLDLAVKQFQEAASEMLAMDATKKEILYKLGLVFERMGKKDESLKCMKDIYEVDYGYLDVAQRVEQSYGS